MKKIFISTLFCSLGLCSFAQNKIGIKAGLTFPTMSSYSEAEAFDGPPEYDFKSNVSFYVGGTIDFRVSDGFTIQPGLTLIGKGGKTEIYESNFEPTHLYAFSGTYKLETMNLELPVNAVFNFNLGNGKLFLGGGPYYAVAISGKEKRNGMLTVGDARSVESSERKVEFGNDKDYKRGDFGLNFLAGYELKNGINIHAGYGLGISSIDTDGFNDSSLKNRVLSVGVGFSF
ncbi:porin family protein [Pedobacter agri]|uniref:porin family protein n=1 Tax=Pedobacter agri TaxID=454586 RepID=UPI00292D11AB|nr:porin family protein [Pedobacter agri]